MKHLISYVMPVYNESDGIEAFYAELDKATKPLERTYDLEFVFVNDGSTDQSLEQLTKLYADDKRVKVINFSRNFGHQLAITAGLDEAKGDAIVIMDSDLQDPPAVSLELISKWEEGYDVVYAQRRVRRDTPFKRWTAHLYYRILRRLADIDIPSDTGDFRLMDKVAATELRRFRERSRYVRGLVAYLGFRQTGVKFDRPDRTNGESHYPLKKMLKLAFDGVTSFSTTPLRMITTLGFAVSLLSVIGIVYALVLKVFFPSVTIEGWTFIAIAILFMGGVQMLSLGVIGAYIGRIYSEVQGRPLYIVSKVMDHNRG